MKTILVDAMHTFIEKETGIFQEMYLLLEKYPNRKIILTNADDNQIITTGLDKMPYEVFTLKHNPEKTNPEYFRILLDRYNLSDEDAIYFDHEPEALISASSIGIKTYQFNSKIKDLIGLKDFLDKFSV